MEGELSTWEILHQTLKIQSIQKLAIQAQDWGTEYNYPPLKIWGTELHSHAGQFNIDTVQQTLNRFPELIKMICSLIPEDKQF